MAFLRKRSTDRQLSVIGDWPLSLRQTVLWSQPSPIAPWEWRHPQVAENGQMVGNARSHVCYAPNFPAVAKMKESNLVPFKTIQIG